VAERAVEPAPSEQIGTIVENLGRVVHAPDETLRLLVLCLVAEGHAIIEDFPGVGKTMLAKVLARSLDCRFSRLQFTPDLLPSDVTGVNVFNQQQNEFEFRPGPVFANLLLVDEVNRASPKTQAALLECMEERQVSVDGVTYSLEPPFMVMATQNPIEYEGTYPLPEAQLDRFTMRLSLGYPPLAEEARMLDEQTSWGSAGSTVRRAGGAQRTDPGALGAAGPPLESLPAVADAADVLRLVEAARGMYVEESLGRYVVALLRQTRSDSRLYLGASPRAGIALLRVAKARALSERRDYVVPDDVKAVAVPVLAHRLILAPEARSAALGPEDLVADALAHTPVPV
jgi:MoxR-like ATPase